MFDIHMHVIPNVDDGAWNMEMATEMLRSAYMQGVRSIMATPHSSAFEFWSEKVYENFELLKNAWEEFFHTDRIFRRFMGDEPLQLYLGCEVNCEVNSMDNILKALKEGDLPSLNKTKYVLTEFNPWVNEKDAFLIVNKLKNEGWIPVIAHAERYLRLGQNDCLERLADEGCFIQINAYSLAEEFNPTIREAANRLLKNKKVTFLGSDAHRMTHRPPCVEKGVKYIYEHCEKEYADQVVFKNAEVLKG